MSFAQKLLEKYGWEEGEGLGKTKSGISKPLKANLKFDTSGLGYDVAAEHNNHWWNRVFSEASSNIQVKNDNENVALSVKSEGSFQISTASYSTKATQKRKRVSYENFVSNNNDNTDGKINDGDPCNIDQLTDEQIFAACGGRTAHKGARHGLTLSGKLARIEQQEREMLKKMQNPPEEVVTAKKRKNKKKDKNKTCESAVDFDEDRKVTDPSCITNYKKSKKQRRAKDDEQQPEELSLTIGNSNNQQLISDVDDSPKAITKTKKKKKRRKES